jgi:ketosteroid isomerase-like protein
MKNKETVSILYALFQKGDIAVLLEQLSDDINWTTGGDSAEIPFAGTRNGKKEVKEFFHQVSNTTQFSKIEPLQLIEEDNCVVALGLSEGINTSTGKTLANHWAHVWYFSNGKVVKFWSYIDTAQIASSFKAETRTASR